MPISGSNGYRSGIVTLPNRVKLREMDSRIGMYPTIARTGDSDRMGNLSTVPFNDEDVHIFKDTSKVTNKSNYDLSADSQILNYSAASNLIFWVDFVPYPYLSGPIVKVGSVSSTTYGGSGFGYLDTDTSDHQLNLIGENRHNVFLAYNALNYEAVIDFASTTNDLSFGDGSSDSPFTISFWYYRNSAADITFERLLAKSHTSFPSTTEFLVTWSPSTPRFYFSLYDASSGGRIQAEMHHLSEDFFDAKWTNIVLTYDGSGSFSGMNIYLNGVKQPVIDASSGTYVAMEAVSTRLSIGDDYDGAPEADGRFAELSFFNTVLSDANIKAIINMTTKRYLPYQVRLGVNAISGSQEYLNAYATPNEDHPAGLYSFGVTKQGITDQPFLEDYKRLTNRKNKNVENLNFYDDSRVNLKDIQFYKTGTLESTYPGFSSKLQDKTIIQIPLPCQEETTFGYTEVSTNGDTNTQLSTTDLSDLKNQFMVYYNKDLKRWEKIARGFGGNTVDTGSFTGTEIYTKVGELIDEAAVGFAHVSTIVATGTQPGNPQQGAEIYSQDALSVIGKPTSVFGFPTHGKFHATGSQVIKMSDYISQPILVEKLNLKFNVKLEFASSNSAGRYAHVMTYISGTSTNPTSNYYEDDFVYVMPTFFMLRQYKQSKTSFVRDFSLKFNTNDTLATFGNKFGTYKKGLANFSTDSNPYDIDFEIPGFFKLNSGSDATTYVDTNRDLITYGQIAWYAKEREDQSRFESMNKLLNMLPGDRKISLLTSGNLVNAPVTSEGNTWTGVADDSLPPVTGTFEFDFKCRTTAVIPPTYGPQILVNDTQRYWGVLGMEYSGGRTLPVDNTTPVDSSIKTFINPKPMNETLRGLVNNIPAYTVGDTVLTRQHAFSSQEPQPTIFPTSSNLDLDSPYILFPEDNIILGWQYPFGSIDHANQLPNQLSESKNNMTLFGDSVLTIFGSQIKQGKEFHDTLNQPLTSEAVHEAIHYDNPVVDQYIINVSTEYSGSYLDDYVTGSVGSEVKSILGEDDNFLSGSFQRFNKCIDNKEVFFDTLKPTLEDLINLDSSLGQINPVGNYKSIDLNLAWHKTFVYNNDLLRSSKEFAWAGAGGGFLGTLAPINSGIRVFGSSGGALFHNLGSNKSVTISRDHEIVASTEGIHTDNNDYNYQVYGFGSGIGHQGFKHVGFAGSTSIIERPRGWKYGLLNGIKQKTSVVFRPDRFTGQRADILEQRRDSRFYLIENAQTLDSPVKVNFVLDDEENDVYINLNEDEIAKNTFESSNISIYCTSSIPYIDDENVVNRNYDNLSNRTIEV